MQTPVDNPERIRANISKMQSQGATPDEIQAYLVKEKSRAKANAEGPQGSAPVNQKPAPADKPATVGSPEEVFTPTPVAEENTKPSYTPDDQRTLNDSLQDDLKAYFEDQHAVGTLTAEGLQDYFKTISGGRLQIADPQASVDNFKKYGWNGVVYGGGNKPTPDGSEPAPQAQTQPAEPKGPVQNVAVRQLGALNEGIADTLGFPVDLVNAGLGALDFGADKLIGDDGIRLSSDKPFLGSDSIRSGMRSLGIGQVDESYAPQNGFEDYSQAFFRGVGQTAVPVLSTISKGGQIYNQMFRTASNPSLVRKALADDAVNAFKRPRGTIAAELGTSTGANLGGELADDVAPDNPYVKTALTLAGGATAGAASNVVSARGTKGRREEAWLEKQIEKNPYAAYDAEIVEDLKRITTSTAKSPTDKAGRAPVTAKEINNLEQTYTGRFKEKIGKLDIPPSEKLKIKEFLDGKYTLDQTNVDLLRGTPEGDAVADGITKVQRLRALTPEIKKYGFGPALKEIISISTGLGASGIDPLASLPAYGAVKFMLQRAANTEAARVNAAEMLLENAGSYQKLGERVGPSGAMESKQTFDNLVNENLDGTWLAKKAAQREAADSALLRKLYADGSEDGEVLRPVSEILAKEKAARTSVKPSMSNASKLVRQQESAAAKLQKELDGIDKKAAAEQKAAERTYEKGLKAETKQVRSDFTEMAKRAETAKNAADRLIGASRKKAEGWQTKFDKETAPKPFVPSTSAQIKLDDIAAGRVGEYRSTDSFAEYAGEGVTRDDVIRALDEVKKDPTIAKDQKLLNDIAFIQNGMNTEQTKGLRQLLGPRIKAVLEADGTMAKVKAQAEQAQAKTSARLKLANPNAETTTAAPQSTPARAAEGDMVGISRPEQWEAGARNFQAQANASISKLDSTSSEKAMAAYGNAPEVVRDNFRTSEEAKEYINEVVMPELEIAGVDPAEIANIRSYLYEVADAKRYSTREAYEAGTKKKK